MRRNVLILVTMISCFQFSNCFGQNPFNGQITFEGFWWNYWNNNYPNGWSNYLADLAPRLADVGINMVWYPPCVKNSSTSSVGYSPFDYYDLGDKYQKGSLKTRLGDKNELLRSIAVMHANGMGSIQDAVLSHMDDAGSNTGAGGVDSNSYSLETNSGYKNYRYVCYAQPAGNESRADYLSRQGRWPMNWENFFPNEYNNHYNTPGNNYDQIEFGTTTDYDSSAWGSSSNATYNPSQYAGYVRTSTRNWMIWFKQQTGCDGFRLDAAKNYYYQPQQDILYNVKYNAGFANGGANMYAVGEVVGDMSDEDNYVTDVQYSNGGTEDLVGTYDFNFRNQIEEVVADGGSYDLSTLPGQQQTQRYRTVPFVNDHDTFRPILDSLGDYIGWDTTDELAGGHIDPFDARLSLAYAIAFSVDGSPSVFFEDLFNIGGTGQRYTHEPTNATELPMRPDLVNLMWCYQFLQFKKGLYNVRYGAPDLLIIERGYNAGPENSYAIIGMNDNYNTWQNATIQTDFGPNVQLHDYSGANTTDIYTDANGKATIYVPPCDSSNIRRGYCVYGKAGITGSFSPTQNSTTQQWEMSNDLGDSSNSSLKQGGAIPASSTAYRLAGKVFDQSGKTITVNVYPTNTSKNLTVSLYNSAGTLEQTTSGTGTLTLTNTPSATGFYSIKVKNTSASNPAQTVYVKVNYTAPAVANTGSYPSSRNSNTPAPPPAEDGFTVVNYPNPSSNSTTVKYTLPVHTWTSVTVYDMQGRSVFQRAENDEAAGTYEFELNTANLASGHYVLNMKTAYGEHQLKIAVIK